MIADDSELIRTLLKQIVEEQYMVAGEAENGAEAVELYRQEEPDLVLMDIVMPIRDGIEAAERITSYDPDATVIMCTSARYEERMQEAIEAGAEGYITKPFQKETVIEKIRTTVST